VGRIAVPPTQRKVDFADSALHTAVSGQRAHDRDVAKALAEILAAGVIKALVRDKTTRRRRLKLDQPLSLSQR
jgi:hypothetical protein